MNIVFVLFWCIWSGTSLRASRWSAALCSLKTRSPRARLRSLPFKMVAYWAIRCTFKSDLVWKWRKLSWKFVSPHIPPFPPEPLSEDSACGENQAGEYAAEDWGIVQKCISWKFVCILSVNHWSSHISGKPLNMLFQVTRLTEELLKSKRQLGRTEERLAESQGVKRFDPRMSFQPKTDKENSMVRVRKFSSHDDHSNNEIESH